MKIGPEILFLDSENAPNIATVWGIHDQMVSYKDIIHEWFLLSIQWSWNDSKKINTTSILDDKKRFKKDFRDDYHVIKTARDIISEADIVVGHNIKGHDLKKIQAKIIEYGIKPLRMPIVIDTYQWSKQFGFTSRKLGDLCSKLDLTDKLSHEPGLFLKASMGDSQAIKDIVTYGIGDIPTLRELYYKLLPHAPTKFNRNLIRGDGIQCCPKCGGDNFHSRGFCFTMAGKFNRFQCMDCGGWFKSGKNVKKVLMR